MNTVQVYLIAIVVLTVVSYFAPTLSDESLKSISSYSAQTLLPLIVTYIAIIASFGKVQLLKNDPVFKSSLMHLMFTWLAVTIVVSLPTLLSYDILSHYEFFDFYPTYPTLFEIDVFLYKLMIKLLSSCSVIGYILLGHNMKVLYHFVDYQISESQP